MGYCEFYNVEILDGYFSGVMILYTENKKIKLDIGYDVEFESLHLSNCKNPLFYDGVDYKQEEIADVYTEYFYIIKEEVKKYIDIHGPLVFAE